MKTYLDLMEKVLEAYTLEHIRSYTKSVEENMIEEHGFPRLCANIGILVSNGRKTELKDDFIRMMDLCCSQIPFAKAKNGRHVGNDFSVKEIVLCLLEAEKSGMFDKDLTDKWRNDLAKINPYKTYSEIAPVPAAPVGNWAEFAAVSEQLRKYAGIGDESEFIENQTASQMFSYDENGMYRDPNEPIVYDLVTRLQAAAKLYFGYDGKYRTELEENFLRSADLTLFMQSSTGEIPYGGRSNQFLHNEAFYAALCEFYADFFKKRGDMEKAGWYKYAAKKAVDYIVPWLEREKITHIKNNYPTDSGYGCEGYAYFDKYMVTTGSWLYLSYAMCDDTIEAVEPPAEYRNFVAETSGHFHKVFLRYGDLYAEYDTNADYHYDSTGLGRIHKRGVPSVICLSTPITAHPNYKTENENPGNLSICAGVKINDGFIYGCDGNITYNLANKHLTDKYAYIEFECSQNGQYLYTEICKICDNGIEITVKSDTECRILFPVFFTDGATKTDITESSHKITISCYGYNCIYSTDSEINTERKEYYNRNGGYYAYYACGNNSVSLKITL